ncbi:MAG: chemotaxis protein CheW [Epsilonproteobacteria bacterium]|nr:chemotaxis protein CheW [Campylobacterota bacterium]
MEFLQIIVQNQHYLFDTSYVSELLSYREPHFMADAHKLVEGVITHKERIVPIVSLRKLLDFESFESKQIALLELVEKQHRAWVEDFELSITEGKEFKKALDPHKCDLGKWIDSTLLCMRCNNNGFTDLLKQHVIPFHNALHNEGAELLADKGHDKKHAITTIHSHAKKTIEGLHLLEQNIKKLTHSFEQIVLAHVEGKEFGFIVDSIEKNHHLDEKSYHTSTHNLSPKSRYIQFIDHYRINDTLMFSMKFTPEFYSLIRAFR